MTKSTAVESHGIKRDQIEVRSVWQAAPLLLLLSLCIAVFTGLGIWQLHRLGWKLDLIATVDARVHASPVPIPSVNTWGGLDVDELIYQRVKLSGIYDHSAEVQSLAVTELGPGFWVMTPLLLERAGSVLINRGFVPQSLKNPASRSRPPPLGQVDITGLLRASEPKGGFLRNNDPGTDRWFSRDTAAMGEAQQLPEPVAPFFIDADADVAALMAKDSQLAISESTDQFPRAGLTVIAFRNTHLAYALTWFALAGMACIGVYLVLRERYR